MGEENILPTICSKHLHLHNFSAFTVWIKGAVVAPKLRAVRLKEENNENIGSVQNICASGKALVADPGVSCTPSEDLDNVVWRHLPNCDPLANLKSGVWPKAQTVPASGSPA